MGIPSAGFLSQGLQVFTPTRIESVGIGGTLDVSDVTAIRLQESNTYQLNGSGLLATIPSGCTGIAKEVNTLYFTNAAIIEVM